MEFEWDPINAAGKLSPNERRRMRKPKVRVSDDLRAEYDLRLLRKGASRGKYAKRYHAETNVVLLDPDVRK
jgi:hypothetical protein